MPRRILHRDESALRRSLPRATPRVRVRDDSPPQGGRKPLLIASPKALSIFGIAHVTGLAAVEERRWTSLGYRAPGRPIWISTLTIRRSAGVRNRDSRRTRNRGWTAATAVPNAPVPLRGVINLRGTVVPVLDLRPVPHARTDDDRLSVTVVVRKWVSRVVGLVVDGVSDVLDIMPDAISPAADHRRGVRVTNLSGIARSADRLVSILSMAQIVGEREPVRRRADQPLRPLVLRVSAGASYLRTRGWNRNMKWFLNLKTRPSSCRASR